MCKVFDASPKHLILCLRYVVGVLKDKSSSSRILEDNFEVIGLGVRVKSLALRVESLALVLALRLVSLTPSLVRSENYTKKETTLDK